MLVIFSIPKLIETSGFWLKKKKKLIKTYMDLVSFLDRTFVVTLLSLVHDLDLIQILQI